MPLGPLSPRCGALLLVLFAALLAAGCGGGSPAPSAMPVDGETQAATAVPTATTEPAAECDGATYRSGPSTPGGPAFVLRLSDPVCVELTSLVGTRPSLVLQRDSGPAQTTALDPSKRVAVIPRSFSPYAPDACPSGRPASLDLALTLGGAGDPFGRLLIRCGALEPSERCSPPGERDGGLALSGSEPGDSCLYFTLAGPPPEWIRVEITFPRIATVYAHLVPGTTGVFRVPEEALPGLADSLDRCLARKAVTITAVALSPVGAESPVGSRSIIDECH